ncbi:hypothetical protein [Altererythrobacter sp. MF3-039]|uniref:hypothetical protein n=1 Tax=Altererythrobacter sp. MF3-039 TaxID=3252901 RepID=UPI00390CCFB4
MKPIYAHFAGAVAVSFIVAACVPAPAATPSPQPTATTSAAENAQPAPPPTPLPEPSPAAVAMEIVGDDWLYAPLTLGDWSYVSGSSISSARFVAPDGELKLTMTCMPSSSAPSGRSIRLELGYDGQALPVMRVLAESRTELLETSRLVGARTPTIFAAIPANHPLFDAIAVTKGRFAVEVPGTETLFLPPWGEVIRVIEDCR